MLGTDESTATPAGAEPLDSPVGCDANVNPHGMLMMMCESREFVELVSQSRVSCLWFTAPDRVPTSRSQQLTILQLVERYGNRDQFVRARRLRHWLLQNSKAAFSVS